MKITSHSIKNKRLYQEDRLFTSKISKDEVIFGIFDGHGAALTAEYASKRTGEIFNLFTDQEKQDEDKILEVIFSILVTETSKDWCGSTALIVWIKNNIAHVGVLGDSIAIIKNKFGNIWISPEHNVRTNEKELIDARQKGAFFNGNYIFNPNNLRSSGLQMSRALGDKELNSILNRDPEIFHIPLNEFSWIVGCSDGVLDPSHKDKNKIKTIIDFIENENTDAEDLVTFSATFEQEDNASAIIVRM
jgi:serine/threonine protein phosphatase PrpC